MRRLSKQSVFLVLGWTFIVLVSCGWNYQNIKESIDGIVLYDAHSHFNKNRSITLWAAQHGGVYVPASEITPPNPFLSHIPERDITTPSGKKLTLLNSAYMLREMMRDYSKEFGIKGRFTSLAYLRKETAPDNWERSALQRFESGAEEISEVSTIGGVEYLRMMRPLHVKKGCLKCHGFQGYKVGDIRGGLSLSIPLTKYQAEFEKNVQVLIVTHLLFLIGGMGLIYMGFGRRSRDEKDKA